MAAEIRSGGLDLGVVYSTLLVESPDEMIAKNPEMLLEFSRYSRRELLQNVADHCREWGYSPADKRSIEENVMDLFIKSLRNSSCLATVETLNQQLPHYLGMTQKRHIDSLIIAARIEILKDIPSSIKQVQKNLRSLRATAARINDFIALYFYSDPKLLDSIRTLVSSETDFEGRPIFAECDRLLTPFINNLERSEEMRERIGRQKQNLLKKIGELEIKEKELMARRESISPVRKRAVDIFAIPFWGAGIQLLEKSFRMTFQEKKERGIFIPELLYGAIGSAAGQSRDRQLVFSNLLKGIPQNLPDRYLHKVWGDFLGQESSMADLTALIELIVEKLPEAYFSQLERELRDSQDQKGTIFGCLDSFLSAQLRGRMTLPRLKGWALQQSNFV